MERTTLPLWIRALNVCAPGTGKHCIQARYDKLSQLHLDEHNRAERYHLRIESLEKRLDAAEIRWRDERAIGEDLREKLHLATTSNEQNRLSTNVAAPEDMAVQEPAEADSEITLTRVRLRDVTQTTQVVPIADVHFLGVVPLHKKHTAIDG